MTEQTNIPLQDAGIAGTFLDASDSVDESSQADTIAFAVAENSYERLRTAIAEHVTAAIQSGSLLVQEQPRPVPELPNAYIYGPVQFSQWHAHLPEVAQQLYNCNYCRMIWAQLSTMAVLHDDGTLQYPVANAVAECSDDPVIAKLLENYPLVKQEMETVQKRQAVLSPIAVLPEYLYKHEVGGFEHFYAVFDLNIIRQFNKTHIPMNDAAYVQNLFQTFISRELNIDLLEKLFLYIKKEIGEKDHTALGLSEELIKVIKNVRRVQSNASKGLVYLWALLHRKENLWLHHVNGSVLGIVLDTALELKDQENMEMALIRVKRLLASATAGENFKQKSSPSSMAALEQTFKFLSEKNLKGTMERRLLPLSEVNSIIWSEVDELPRDDSPSQQTSSAADAAFQKLKGVKDTDLAVNKKMDQLLGNVLVERRMSIAEFIRTLNDYAELSISNETKLVAPLFATGAATEGNHDELLSFDKEVGDTVNLLSTPDPYNYSTFAKIAAQNVNEDAPSIFTNIFSNYGSEIPVKAIFRSNRIKADECNYVLHIEGFAFNFQKQLPQHGSCILGSMIKSEHYGMSRALVELSKQIPMQTQAGKDAAGGAFLIVNTVLNALLKDGTRAKINITSVK